MAPCTNIFIENLQSSPNFASSEPSKPEPFCSFCMQERPQNVEFYKHVIGASQEMRNSLQSMLGYDFNLTNFAICKPCWKLIQLIQDFRLRSFKANEVVQRMSKGLSNGNDGWFSAKNLAMIENVRMSVQEQMRHIENVNTTKRELVLDDSTDEVAVEENINDDLEPEADKEESSDARDEILETQERSSKQEDTAIIEMDTVRPVQHECVQCHRIFKSEMGLRNHGPFCVHHIPGYKHGTSATFQCTQNCDKLFFSEPRRAHHERLCAENARNLACQTCGKRFKSRCQLRTHEWCKHSENARIFPCKVCGKMFKQKYAVTLHMNSHAASEPFECQSCPMKYWSKHSLTQHVKKMHMNSHAASEPFVCQSCPMKYWCKQSLTYHVKKMHADKVSATVVSEP